MLQNVPLSLYEKLKKFFPSYLKAYLHFRENKKIAVCFGKVRSASTAVMYVSLITVTLIDHKATKNWQLIFVIKNLFIFVCLIKFVKFVCNAI